MPKYALSQIQLLLYPIISGTTPQIGFDWLCFSVPRRAVYCHNILSNKSLRHFHNSANWLCFFKFLFLILTLSAERRTLNANRLALIGFVFSPPQNAFFIISPFSTGIYTHFNPFKIGFVFSNLPFQFVSDLELSASDFQPKAGNWL